MIYAIYRDKVYLANIRQLKVRLKTRIPEVGFNKLIDLAGNIHDDIFIKEVNIDDVSLIYETDYRATYQGSEYKCLNVTKKALYSNRITIYTNDSNIAEQYGFAKIEQFVYDKDIPLDEIDTLVEIRKPIQTFRNAEAKITVIQKNDIRGYLSNIIE